MRLVAKVFSIPRTGFPSRGGYSTSKGIYAHFDFEVWMRWFVRKEVKMEFALIQLSFHNLEVENYNLRDGIFTSCEKSKYFE